MLHQIVRVHAESPVRVWRRGPRVLLSGTVRTHVRTGAHTCTVWVHSTGHHSIGCPRGEGLWVECSWVCGGADNWAVRHGWGLGEGVRSRRGGTVEAAALLRGGTHGVVRLAEIVLGALHVGDRR